jgi:hypothetical protein
VRVTRIAATALVSVLLIAACGDESDPPAFVTPPPASGIASAPPSSSASPSASAPSASPTPTKKAVPRTLPKPGNPSGRAAIPAEAAAVDTRKPDRVIGKGNPASCTSDAVVSAVAAGGIITFNCGPSPVTITMTRTAKVKNANGPRIVLDGGGRVTLSGAGKRRILYMNTCDAAQGHTTSHCQDQDSPRLTVQNLVFARGNSTGEKQEGGGGGAIFVRGGRVKVVNSRFVDNRCDTTGPDLGGAALRVLDQSGDKPVYVVDSTFTGGQCSNGGALSSIGVSWTLLNSVFENNRAIGRGANPARSGTPGGGSGGAVYTDGDKFEVLVNGTIIRNNNAREGGGAIFFVSNDRTGSMTIRNSTLKSNRSQGFENSPGIFFLGATLTR